MNRELPGGVMRRLFSARSLVLFDRLERSEIASYIDGLLAGSELLEAQSEWPLADLPIRILGAGVTADNCRDALAALGHAATITSPGIGPIFARIHAERINAEA